MNRATIGEGTIIIRSDPSQGLEGLNRDLKRAQELTKDSKTTVKVYVDPATIKEIADAAEGVIAKIQKARADAKIQERLNNAKLSDDLKSLEDKGGLDAKKAMIANGATDEQADALLHNKQYQSALKVAQNANTYLDKVGAKNFADQLVAAYDTSVTADAGSDNGAISILTQNVNRFIALEFTYCTR